MTKLNHSFCTPISRILGLFVLLLVVSLTSLQPITACVFEAPQLTTLTTEEGDGFNKRKAKKHLKAVFVGQEEYNREDILQLHKASIALMEQYPKQEAKIQQLTISVANEYGYSFRFHPDERSIIYRKLTEKEMEEVAKRIEMEEAEEEIVAITPTTLPEIATKKIRANQPLLIKAFPNPTTEKVTISFSGNTAPAILTLLDMQGKEIYQERIQPAGTNFQKTLKVATIARGVVTIQVTQGGEQVQQKLIVVK